MAPCCLSSCRLSSCRLTSVSLPSLYSASAVEGDTVAVLVIASSKGGPGKTTLASLIVGTLAAEGLAVVAIDADPTSGLYRWTTKTYEGPPFEAHAEADEERLAHLIGSTAARADLVLVDTAGFGNRAATVAM